MYSIYNPNATKYKWIGFLIQSGVCVSVCFDMQNAVFTR